MHRTFGLSRVSACLKKPFSVEELLQVCTGCLGNERQQEQIDFHALLEYGDRLEMLETLIRETTDDIAAMAESAERNDCESLREWIHHLSSSWEIIHAGKPLRDLFMQLQGDRECATDEFDRAVRKVLDKGKEIIDLAQQAKETYESDCGWGQHFVLRLYLQFLAECRLPDSEGIPAGTGAAGHRPFRPSGRMTSCWPT